MLKHVLECLYRREWIFDSPIGVVGVAYENYLRERRYSESSIHVYLASVAHFAYWIKRKHIDLESIDEQLCKHFIVSHVPRCACSEPRQVSVINLRAALKHLRVMLFEQGFVQNEEQIRTPVLDELEKFYHYLKCVRGLADNTCEYRLKYIRLFLMQKFGEGRVSVTELNTKDIEDFVLGFANRWKPACLGVIRATLVSYLRYKAMQGNCTQSLISAMPVIADWKGSACPKALTEEELQLFFQSFDLSYSTGRRDYAIARCLFDLALRGHEVTLLRLDSLNWHEGTITIGGSKARRVQQLPLPPQTGEAIAGYLRFGRPNTTNRALFVRHVAPFDKPITVCAIRNAVNGAFTRCGLDDRFCSTHVLRHTMAIRLQRSGASLKEIADVLRHKSLESTTVYTNADLRALTAVALPWPGKQS